MVDSTNTIEKDDKGIKIQLRVSDSQFTLWQEYLGWVERKHGTIRGKTAEELFTALQTHMGVTQEKISGNVVQLPKKTLEFLEESKNFYEFVVQRSPKVIEEIEFGEGVAFVSIKRVIESYYLGLSDNVLNRKITQLLKALEWEVDQDTMRVLHKDNKGLKKSEPQTLADVVSQDAIVTDEEVDDLFAAYKTK